MGADQEAGMSDSGPWRADLFQAIWRDIENELTRRRWTRRRLATAMSEHSSVPITVDTLYDQIRKGRVVSWEIIRCAALALGLSESVYKKRWEQANNAPRRPKSLNCVSARGKSFDSAQESNVTKEEQVALPPVPPRDLPGSAIAATFVVADHAGVYRIPGDLDPLAIKVRGEKITLPCEIPAFTGADGRNYRMVRTPTRTLSGYAYMLADTLGPLEC